MPSLAQAAARLQTDGRTDGRSPASLSRSLRNARGLTAADIAQTQGFPECSRFLAGLHDHGHGHHHHGRRAAASKRGLDAAGLLAAKRARSEAPAPAPEDDADSMLVDREPAGLADAGAPGPAAGPSANGHAHPASPPAPEGPPTGTETERPGPTRQPPTPEKPPDADLGPETCGSLHLGGSPSSCVAGRPCWAEDADAGASLHYGHYHGFGDTAESLPAAPHRDPTS